MPVPDNHPDNPNNDSSGHYLGFSQISFDNNFFAGPNSIGPSIQHTNTSERQCRLLTYLMIETHYLAEF